MRTRSVLLWLSLLACTGCSKTKSTTALIEDLRSPQSGDRIIAVRLLAQRKKEGATIVPALILALKDTEGDIRQSAAIGLGAFGDQAQDAIPALQQAQNDRDARVREAASTALSRIDPAQVAPPKEPRR